MVSADKITSLIEKARGLAEKKNFTQSVELAITLKDIDVKKGFALNEVIGLPHSPTRKATICVIGSGEMGQRAKRANADKVLEGEELNRIAANKREAKKLVRSYDFFIADTGLMPLVGKTLGQYLGPRGKMATPLPYNAPIENILDRFRTSVRVRSKAQLNVSCKIGDEGMSDADLAENATTVISAIERKLPNAEKNIRNVMVKLTMGKNAKMVEAKLAEAKVVA